MDIPFQNIDERIAQELADGLAELQEFAAATKQEDVQALLEKVEAEYHRAQQTVEEVGKEDQLTWLKMLRQRIMHELLQAHTVTPEIHDTNKDIVRRALYRDYP